MLIELQLRLMAMAQTLKEYREEQEKLKREEALRLKAEQARKASQMDSTDEDQE